MEPQMARNDTNSNDKLINLQPQRNLKCNLKNLKLNEIVQFQMKMSPQLNLKSLGDWLKPCSDQVSLG